MLKKSRSGSRPGGRSRSLKGFISFPKDSRIAFFSRLTGPNGSGKTGIQADVEDVEENSHQRIDDKSIAGDFHFFPTAIFAYHNDQDRGTKLGQQEEESVIKVYGGGNKLVQYKKLKSISDREGNEVSEKNKKETDSQTSLI